MASATTISTSDHPMPFNREQVNLESHQLLWLDVNVKSSTINSKITVEGLRKIVDYAKLFDDIEECIQFIQDTKETTTFVVCSGQLGKTLVPEIYNLTNMWSIYIYCMNKEYHIEWTSNYSKVKAVHTELNLLLKCLTEDVQKYLKQENHTVFNPLGVRDLTTDDSQFSWWIPFIDILCYLPYPENYRSKLINSLKEYYKGNSAQIHGIDEFERNYVPSKAIWWYTRNTFLYRLLNKTLRQHNIKLIFLFGFFVQDIYRQLRDEYEIFKSTQSNKLKQTLYRGQIMTSIEITDLQQGYKWIVNNSFFSTTPVRSVALRFLNPSLSSTHSEFQNVLFEIEIDIQQPYKRPYASVSHLSQFANERETIFMYGTEFKRGSVFYDDNEKIWIAKLELIDVADVHDNVFTGLENANNREILIDCVQILPARIWMASLKDQTTIFNELIELYPSERWIKAAKLLLLAKRQRVQTALSNYDQAVKIMIEYINHHELKNTFSIDTIIGDMASCCRYGLTDNKVDITYAEDIIESILQYCSLIHVCPCIEAIGDLCKRISKYDHALIDYDKALQIYIQQNSELKYHSIIGICSKVVKIYSEEKHDYDSALKFQLMKHQYILKASENTSNLHHGNRQIADSHVELGDTYLVLKQYNLSNDQYIDAMKLYQKIESDDAKNKILAVKEKLKTVQTFLI